MSFDNWYYLNYPDLKPKGVKLHKKLKQCWEAALEISEHHKGWDEALSENSAVYSEGWKEGYSQHKKETIENLKNFLLQTQDYKDEL